MSVTEEWKYISLRGSQAAPDFSRRLVSLISAFSACRIAGCCLEMANICLQCGDIGLSVALVYCVKCRSAARHSYCLEEVPEDLAAEINWLCEDCVSEPLFSASKSKFHPPTSLGIVNDGVLKDPFLEIGSANDCLANPEDQNPVSNVIFGSVVDLKDLDNQISGNLKKTTLSCTVNDALGTDKFDNSQPLVEAQGTDIQFAAKSAPFIYVEASENLIIGGTSNCDICGLGRSSGGFGREEDEIDEFEKEGSKRKGLNLPGEDDLLGSHPLVNGEGTDLSLPVKRMSSTSSVPSEGQIIRTGCNNGEEELEQHDKRNSKSRRLILHTNNFYPLTDSQVTSISFVKKKSSGAPVKQADRPTGTSLNNDTHPLDARRSSACLTLKIDEVEKCGRGSPERRSIVPYNDGQGTISSAVEGIVCTSIEPSDNKASKRTSSFGTNSLAVVGSSTCFRLKESKITSGAMRRRNRKMRLRRKKLIQQIKDGRQNFYPAIFHKHNNIPVVAKRLQGIPVEASNKQVNRYRKDQSESRNLILRTEAESNSLCPVIDRRGTNTKFAAERLPCTSVELPRKPSFPVFSHIWRGYFNIDNVELGPLSAHLSSSACLKVCNLAKELPLILHMQKLPRLVAWPNSFKVSSPTDEHVALYFFPGSYRGETVLDELVDDIINNDLMLRFEFDEVELLIFSSFVLPQDHQRFYGKYYPWGVFKPKVGNLPADPPTGYQVVKSLNPVRINEVEDINDGSCNHSAQESNDFTLIRSSIQPGEGELGVTYDSMEEGEFRPLAEEKERKLI
ncbi:uncharacterized protein LOC110020065 [Phalaenopsis equestris]|uniref:uncharacterized protein LOC110020065 n=1 Tax=Phalaenopsis equestris TaxID=78828 RepID=UPI0009E5469C|nr:uncharacterized protein LOC110020065 [Phalaenopsis equestris]